MNNSSPKLFSVDITLVMQQFDELGVIKMNGGRCPGGPEVTSVIQCF